MKMSVFGWFLLSRSSQRQKSRIHLVCHAFQLKPGIRNQSRTVIDSVAQSGILRKKKPKRTSLPYLSSVDCTRTEIAAYDGQ